MGQTQESRPSKFILRFYRVLHGKVVEAEDIVAEEVADVPEFKKEIQYYLEEYLVLFEGKRRERPCSGRIPIRVRRGLHRKMVKLAEAGGTTVNALIAARLEEAAQRSGKFPHRSAKPRRSHP